jgi:hypothetical protein
MIFTVVMVGCLNTGNRTYGANEKKQTKNNVSKITFKPLKAKAIIIGNSIKLLDINLKVIDDLSKLTTKYVEITGISDSLFNDTKDICNAYW